jgi:hypothetical protein
MTGSTRVSFVQIISSRITTQPQTRLDPMPVVYVTLEGGDEQRLFEYFPDEITFTPGEFVGLTLAEAHALKLRKDKEYLQS